MDEINDVMDFYLLNTFESDEKEGFQIGMRMLIGF